jgi:hypothetical protein
MADEAWTVKDLMEALKRFPPQAKVYYELGRTVPEQWDRRNTSRSGETRRWECCWSDSEDCSRSRKTPHTLKEPQDGLEKKLVHEGSQ